MGRIYLGQFIRYFTSLQNGRIIQINDVQFIFAIELRNRMCIQQGF